MTIKEIMANDSRFYIDNWNLDRITKREIRSYEIIELPLKKIQRIINGKVIPLWDTDIYKYIDGSEKDKENYLKYCKLKCYGNNNRGTEQFDQLIRSFSIDEYNLHKGGIFVDQMNFILEGNHRCCILLKNYGPNQKIKVVRIHYKGLYLRSRLKVFISRLKYWRCNI